MKTKIKSPLLNSASLRKQMAHRADVEFQHAFRVIDDLSNAYDALSALHETHEPDLTMEGAESVVPYEVAAHAIDTLAADASRLGVDGLPREFLRQCQIRQEITLR